MFTVAHVTDADIPVALDEPMGSKSKFWYTDTHGCLYLFKFDHRGTGEDWAEVVASELCRLLELPHAEYHLAEYQDRTGKSHRGTISRNFVPEGFDLILGNDLLATIDPYYPVSYKKYNVSQHTTHAIVDAIKQVLSVPDNFTVKEREKLTTAIDYFVGYMMLDVWIANQDRHHENWGVLKKLEDGSLFLSPTFDHGASFANHMQDSERHERMTTNDKQRHVKEFVKKAKSAVYSSQIDKKPMTTLDTWKMFAAHSPMAAAHWVQQMQSISQQAIHNVLDNVPENLMSYTSKKFTLKILEENSRRLQENTNE